MSIENLNNRRVYSEVRPFRDDFPGFASKADSRSDADVKSWASDSFSNAKIASLFYCAEAPLKLVRHFVEDSEYKGSMIANLVYSGERLFGILGDVKRNLIYGHKDSKGKRDDILGAQEFDRKQAGCETDISLGGINYYSQTGGKLALVALGLYNAELANDIEWAFVNNLDRWWWTGMGTNLAFGPDFSKRCMNSIKGIFNSNSESGNNEKLTKDYIFGQFANHIKGAKDSWFKFLRDSDKEKKKESLLKFCDGADKTISAFSPIVNSLSTLANVTRPILRRLDLTGFTRNSIRILSVINKPYSCLINTFRFYIPEKFTRTNDDPFTSQKKVFNFLAPADMLLAATIGNATDFISIVFENVVKESSGNIRHLLELSRKLTKSLEEGYFCLRRMYPIHDIEHAENKSKYEKLQSNNLEQP